MQQTLLMPCLLSEISGLGPFFAVKEHPTAAPLLRSWRPLAELVTDPAAMPARIDAVRSALASGGRADPVEQRADLVERRVAASAVLLGLAARLLSPALAAAVIGGELLDLDLARLRWRPEVGAAFRLSLPAGGNRPGPERIEALAGRLATDVLAGPIRQLVAAVRAACSLSPLVAWGNAGSALNGAAIVIGQQRPELAGRTYRLTAAVLALAPLGMTDPVAGPGFRRTSCCLLYRAASGGRGAVCADCVLPRA
jgi:hypothetical protein